MKRKIKMSRPMNVQLEITEEMLSEKVGTILYGEALERVMSELADTIINDKSFKKALKEKLVKEINKQLDGKIKDFVENITIDH